MESRLITGAFQGSIILLYSMIRFIKKILVAVYYDTPMEIRTAGLSKREGSRLPLVHINDERQFYW